MTRRGRERFAASLARERFAASLARARAELAAGAARGANFREAARDHCPDGPAAESFDRQARDLRALAARAGWRAQLNGASPDD